MNQNALPVSITSTSNVSRSAVAGKGAQDASLPHASTLRNADSIAEASTIKPASIMNTSRAETTPRVDPTMTVAKNSTGNGSETEETRFIDARETDPLLPRSSNEEGAAGLPVHRGPPWLAELRIITSYAIPVFWFVETL